MISKTVERLKRDFNHSTKVSTKQSDLKVSSHDTWPLMTKLNLLGQHPNMADIVVKAENVGDINTV